MPIIIDNERYCLGIDVSHYQPRINYKLLKDAGLTYLVAKSSQAKRTDAMFRTHIIGAVAAGLVPIVYHWDDPLVDSEEQVEYLLSITCDLPIFEYWLDDEQWWASWDKWGQANQKKIPWSEVPRVDPGVLSKHYHDSAVFLASRVARPVTIYTRISFMQEYAPGMREWVGNYNVALAQYPYDGTRQVVDWEEFMRYHMPLADGPKLGMNITEWRHWQISGDKFLLPGIYAEPTGDRLSPVDIDVFNGSLSELRNGVVDPPCPEPEEEEEMLAIDYQALVQGQKIRTAPRVALDTLTGRTLNAGDILTGLQDMTVLSSSDVWAKFESVEGWVAVVHGGTQFLKRMVDFP